MKLYASRILNDNQKKKVVSKTTQDSILIVYTEGIPMMTRGRVETINL